LHQSDEHPLVKVGARSTLLHVAATPVASPRWRFEAPVQRCAVECWAGRSCDVAQIIQHSPSASNEPDADGRGRALLVSARRLADGRLSTPGPRRSYPFTHVRPS